MFGGGKKAAARIEGSINEERWGPFAFRLDADAADGCQGHLPPALLCKDNVGIANWEDTRMIS